MRRPVKFKHVLIIVVMAAILRNSAVTIGSKSLVQTTTIPSNTSTITDVPTLQIGQTHVTPVDCTAVLAKEEGNDIATLVTLRHKSDHPFVVSFPKWVGHSRAKDQMLEDDGGSTSYQFLPEIRDGEIYIDVGANIGQTSMPALVQKGLETYAFDPLEFDIVRICEGWQANLDRGYVPPQVGGVVDPPFYLFRTLVGDQLQESFNISRPYDDFGKFEQASIFSNTIGVMVKPKLVTESVPMLTLDALIPPHKAIGLVKIDVQGAEMMVVKGMTQILSRSTGYPAMILYEEQARVTNGAGGKLGAVQAFLEGFGYTCEAYGKSDNICRKSRVVATNLRH